MFKKFSSFFLRFGISAGLILFLFSKIDFHKIIEAAKGADFYYLSVGFFLFLFINTLLFFRWHMFLMMFQIKFTVLNCVRAYCIGLFGNLFLPSAMGGDLLKAVHLCKDTDQRTKVVASILLDRLAGFASIIMVALIAFVVGYRHMQDPLLLLPIGAIAFVSATGACVLFSERIYSFFCGFLKPFPKFKNILMKLHYDVVILKQHPRHAILGIVISSVSQLCFCYSFYIIATALGADVQPIYFFMTVPLICIIAFLPSIGGLGVREMGAVYLFSRVGLTEDIALTTSLLSFAYVIIVGLMGGLLYVLTLYSRRIQCDEQDVIEPGVES